MIRPGVWRILRLPLLRRDVTESELEEEIRLHLELRAEQLEREGLPPAAARAEAVRRFGPPEEARRLRRAARQRERGLRTREWLLEVRQAVAYGARTLGRTPGQTVVVIAALALGIGLCTSIYSVVRGVMLDPVPFPDGDRLLSVALAEPQGLRAPYYSDYRAWSGGADEAVGLAAYAVGSHRVGTRQGTVEAFSLRVSDGFFGVLGARMHLGRALGPGDATAGSAPAAVISHRLWLSLLGGDSAAVGAPIHVGGQQYSLVGVLRPGQEFPAPVDAWTPLVAAPAEVEALRVTVVGRLRDGATRDEAGAALGSIHVPPVADREPGAVRAVILPLTGQQNDVAHLIAFLLALSVGSILVIGVANASGLIVTRALGRRRELAIRTALGASRLRIAALLLTEAVLVTAAAAAAGLLIAHTAMVGLRRIIPDAISRQLLGWEQLGLDGHAIAFSIALAVLAGIGCGLIPALGTSRPDVRGALQQSAPSTTAGPRQRRLLRTLVIGEVTLSVLLLLSAGLLTRNLLALVGDEPGFDATGLATLRWSVPPPRDAAVGGATDRAATPDAGTDVTRRLLDRAAAVPGVVATALASELPASRPGFAAVREYEFDGAGGSTRGYAGWRVVSPEYLDVLGIPLLAGRSFTAADGATAQRVAIASESLAARLGSGDARAGLGSQVTVAGERWTIVGVARDVRGPATGDDPAAALYVPHEQQRLRAGYIVSRLAGSSGQVGSALREEVWRVDSGIALGEVRPMQAVLAEMVAEQRLVAVLVAVYAATALIITLISLYAIVAHLVVCRRPEFGIRAALGASPSRVVRSAMARALVAAAAGTAAGTALAVALSRVIAGLLHGVAPLDPWIFGALPILLFGVFAAAVYVPARAAARVDPVTAVKT